MKKNIYSKLLVLVLVLSFVINPFYCNVLAKANTNINKKKNTISTYVPDYYDNVLYGDEWQKEYTITVQNKVSKKVITQSIKSVNDIGIISKDYITQKLDKKYELIDFNVVENEKYQIKYGYVETLFDIGCLCISIGEFVASPSFWNGFNVVIDGASVFLPCVPALSGASRMIKSSSELKAGAKLGIKPYSELRKLTSGTRFDAHHIMPQKFASHFNCNANDMFCLAVDKEYHKMISSRTNSMFPKAGSVYSQREARNGMKYIYQQLYYETDDEIFEFMANYIEEMGRYQP